MRPRYRAGLAVVLAAILMTGDGRAALAGDSTRVSLLELYTSEGCNSCPPTDRRVSALPRPFVPEKLVVLAFHVDYWNYLGWPDRFSQRAFTARQQALVRVNGLRTAYTPQLVLNGRDYRGFGSIESDVTRINTRPAAARLALHTENKAAAVHVRSVARLTTPTAETATLYVALFENNLETQVEAGENRGRRLRHDYVVRTLLGPFPVTNGRELRQENKIALAADWKIADLGVAAFVQSERTGEILQATARMLR